MKKLIQKLFSGLGMAALVMIFGVVGGVFAATNWSTWTADMTKAPGDALTSSSWNKMVAAIQEDHDALTITTTTANTALANASAATTAAAAAQTTANTALAKAATLSVTRVAYGGTLPTDKTLCFSDWIPGGQGYANHYVRVSGVWYDRVNTATTTCNWGSSGYYCDCI